MASPDLADPIINWVNFSKLYLMYCDANSTLLLCVFKWLKNSEDVAEYITQNKKWNVFTKDEKTKIEAMSKNRDLMTSLDVSLLFKLIQNVTKLSSLNLNWKDEIYKGKLENLIWQMKDKRNSVSHKENRYRKLTDKEIHQECEELKKISKEILNLAGTEGNISTEDIDKACETMKNEFERIRDSGNEQIISGVRRISLKKHLKKEVELLNKFFENELLEEDLKSYLPRRFSKFLFSEEAVTVYNVVSKSQMWKTFNDKVQVTDTNEYATFDSDNIVNAESTEALTEIPSNSDSVIAAAKTPRSRASSESTNSYKSLYSDEPNENEPPAEVQEVTPVRIDVGPSLRSRGPATLVENIPKRIQYIKSWIKNVVQNKK